MDRTYFEFTTNQLWDEFLANKWNWNVLSDLAEELKWRHRPGARGLAAQVKRQLELAKTWTVRNYQGADRIERSFEALKQKLEVKRQEREAELAEARALVTVQPGDTLVLGNGAMMGLLKKARSADSIAMSTSCGGWHDRQSDPRPVGVLCLRIAA